MKRFGVIYLLGPTLLFVILTSLFGGQAVLATPENTNHNSPSVLNQEEPLPEEKLEFQTSFPIVSGKSNADFIWEVQPFYEGSEPKVFEFFVSSPEGWQTSLKRQFQENEPSVVGVRLLPGRGYPDKYTLTAKTLPGNIPEAGEYAFILEGAAGNVSGSIELTAVVTEKPFTYQLDMVTNTGRLDTPVKASEDNTVSIKITNTGTGAIENIVFSSLKSEGWGISFTPDKVETLEPGESQDVDVVITPPSKTIAGDYHIALNARGDAGASDSVALRATVQTSTFWGAAGAGIVAGVVIGLVFLFRRLGRR